MLASKAVGIDLGTTNSCIGVYENGEINILSNIHSKRTTPSIVGIIGSLKMVGQQAKDEMASHPANVIFSIKRLIGRKIYDPRVQEIIKNLPYKIVANNGNAAVEVECHGNKTIFTPEQISALILKNLMSTANRYLPFEVKDAVITIPAYFNDSQRQATIDAAKIARINVLRIINEPTAAALAYAYKKKWKNGIILVYDLGGGTFDVSVIKVTEGTCEVLAVDGDDHLGGEDIDNILVNYCVKEFQSRHGYNISNNAESMCILKAECEEAKVNLSCCKFAPMVIRKLCNDDDLECKINQEKFNELCKDFVEKTLRPVRSVLEEAKITKNDINNVVLVGGSTRIPYIRKTLTEFFDDKKLNFDINPDEAVASGAAILAAHLSKSFDTSIQNIRLLDVIPRSLGTDLYRNRRDKKGYFNIVAKRNTQFPFIRTCRCSTVCQLNIEPPQNFTFTALQLAHCTLNPNQTEIDFVIYEGEDDEELSKNQELGKFTLMNVAPGRPGDYRIEITFSVNENAILTVTAMDDKSGSAQSIEIRPDTGRLTDAQILEMSRELYFSFDEIIIDD